MLIRLQLLSSTLTAFIDVDDPAHWPSIPESFWSALIRGFGLLVQDGDLERSPDRCRSIMYVASPFHPPLPISSLSGRLMDCFLCKDTLIKFIHTLDGIFLCGVLHLSVGISAYALDVAGNFSPPSATNGILLRGGGLGDGRWPCAFLFCMPPPCAC